MTNVFGVDHAEALGGDTVAEQAFVGFNGAGVRGMAVGRDAMQVVHLLHAVNADSDEEALFSQELAPSVIKEQSVGLDAVENVPSFRTVLLLKGDDPAESFESEKGGFTAMPGELDRGIGTRFDMLNDVGFEQFIRDGADPSFLVR